MEVFEAILAGIIGASGATIGSTAIYLVVRKVGRFGVMKYGRYLLLDEKKLSRVEDWFEKHGSKAVFRARMAPGMREIISVPAGISK
jgi:membrane protein DedA with SNARE-associated domain